MKTEDAASHLVLPALRSVLARRGYRRSALGLFNQGDETWRKGDTAVGIPYPLTTLGAEEVVSALAAEEGMPVSAVIDELEEAARAEARWQANHN